MATTAKQSSSVRGSSASASSSPNFAESAEEDIETIAKQISDHAEAIYQNWKARGLAPTEILNCHTGNSDAFGKTLTPPIHRSKESPVTELLAQAPDMSNNNLEKLVSSFVNEDKARQQRKSNILTSGTIKDALRKFECADRNTNEKPNFLRNTSPQPNNQRNSSPQPSTNGNKLNKNVPDVLMNTIEQVVTVKELSPPRQKPETPAKPASLINHTPTWPLKNRLGSSPIKKDAPNNGEEIKTVKQSEKLKKSSDLMDEVLMEEERLINALKTGTVLNNDKTLPEVITSTLLTTDVTDRGTTWTKPSISTTTSSTSTTIIYDEVHHKSVTNQSPDMAPTNITKSLRPRNDAAVPHPEVNLNSLKANHNVGAVNPAVRPFLTRGSVAERVLMFEKCPEAKALRNIPKEPAKLASTGLAQQTSSIDNKSMVKSCNVDLTCELCNNHIVYADEMAFIHSDCLPSIAEKLQPKQETSVDFKNHDRSSKSKHNGQRKSSHYSPILKIPLKPFMRMKKSELLKCSTCKTQFENAEMGRQHYRLVHDRNCIECMYCDSVLTKKEKLDEHMRKYH